MTKTKRSRESHLTLTTLIQLLEHTFKQLPGAVLGGVGQGGTLGSFRQSQMPQLAFATGQPSTNLAQRLGLTQLTKKHRHQQAPTTENPGVSLGLMLLYQLFELQTWKYLEELREDAAYFWHGGISLS